MRPVYISSAASADPSSLGRKKLLPISPPPSPILVNAQLNFASGAAMRRSQASAMERPPPAAAPLTAAISGWGILRSRTTRSP